MPYQIKPKISLYYQNLSQILETLLPLSEELSLLLWYHEDDDFESIGDIESGNKFQFPNPIIPKKF